MNLFAKPLDFTRYFNRVVEWNAIARNGEHDFSEEAKAFQLTLVNEEFSGKDELVDGYNTLNKEMVLDALCDIFVTSAYLYFQECEGNVLSQIEIAAPSSSIDYFNQLKYSIEGLGSGRETVKDVCALLYQFDGCVTKALDEVLNSNDSKFPKFGHGLDGEPVFYVNGLPVSAQQECKDIEERSDGRYTGVTYSVVGEGDDKKFIFKSDKGKIVKPCSFFEPNLSKFC